VVSDSFFESGTRETSDRVHIDAISDLIATNHLSSSISLGISRGQIR
jgi:hypothetical protein